MDTSSSWAASQNWLTRSVILQGEFLLLDGVHLLCSDDGRLVACWSEGHETVHLLDAASVGWPVLPLVVPPNLMRSEDPGPLRRSSDGTALVWVGNDYFGDDQPLLDLGKGKIVLSVGEGIRKWGPHHECLRAWGDRRPDLPLDLGRAYDKPPSDGWAIANAAASSDKRLLAIDRCSWLVDVTQQPQYPRLPLSQSTQEAWDTVPRMGGESPERDAWLAKRIDDETRYRRVHPPIEIWNIAGERAELVGAVGEFPSASAGIVGFDPGNRHLVLGNGEAWDISGNRLDPEMTRELRKEFPGSLRFAVIDDRLVAMRDYEPEEWADAESPFARTTRLRDLEQERRRSSVELKDLAKSNNLRQNLVPKRESDIAHAWSRDKSLVATHERGSQLVQIWSVDSGHRVGTFALTATGDNHHDHLCFSLDNRLLLVTGERVVSSVWDWEAGRLLWSLPGIDRPPDSPLTLSPDGRLVACEIYGVNGISVSSIQTNQVLLRDEIPAMRFSGVAFSPDGSSVAVRVGREHHDRRMVRIWGPRDPKRSSGRTLGPDALGLLDKVAVGRGAYISGPVNPEMPLPVVQWAAVLAGESETTSTQSVCPTIGKFVEAIGNLIDDDILRTGLLRPLIPCIVGSRSTDEVEARRVFVVLDFIVRQAAALAFEQFGLRKRASTLRQLPPITDNQSAIKIYPVVKAARDEARGLDPPIEGDGFTQVPGVPPPGDFMPTGPGVPDAAWALEWVLDVLLPSQIGMEIRWSELRGEGLWRYRVLRALGAAVRDAAGPATDIAVYEAAVKCVDRMLTLT